MYRIFVVLALILCSLQAIQAQIKASISHSNSKIDSLSRLFDTAKDDASKIKILVNAPKRMREYFEKPAPILNLYYKAFKLAEGIGDKKSVIKLLMEIAYFEMYVTLDEPKAFKLYSQALSYAEEEKDYASCAKICFELAAISEHQNFKAEMYEYMLKAIAFNQKSPVLYIRPYRWAYAMYLEDNRIEDALKIGKQAVSYVDERSVPVEFKALAYGYYYAVLKRIPSRKQEADNYKQKIIRLLDKIKIVSSSTILDGIATVCFEVEKYELAIFFASQMFEKTDWDSQRDISKVHCYEMISASYERLGQYQKSLENYKKYSTTYVNVIKNSLTLESGRKVIRAEGERNLFLKQKEIDKARFYRNISFAIAVFIVILGAVIFFFYRREQRRKAELAKLNATKDKLFAILSHDFRSPLANLQTFMSLINWGAISQAEFAESAKDFSLQLNNVQSMLDNILNWSISQMGGMLPNMRENNLFLIIEEQISLYRPVANAKQIEIINEVCQEVIVFADTNHLKIIFRNLLQNAIKFTNSQGKIIFSFREDNQHKIIEISDNGIGLSAEKLKTIFELDKSTSGLGTHYEQGTGLGLTLVRELVAANNGEIRVQSTLGVGTTFTIYFKYPR